MPTPAICVPQTDNEYVIEIYSGPKWAGALNRWEWSFMMYMWNEFPAYCGKCGRCTNPANVEPCGHPEAKRYVFGQAYVSSIEEWEKRITERGATVRYVREGKTIGSAEATKHDAA